VYDILVERILRGLAVDRRAAALRLIGIGFYIAGCIILGGVLGVWLDRKVDISPLFTLLGLGVGLFAAFFGTYRMLLPAMGKKQGRDKGDS
jgi:F0F1-type ATP synthase assembly protein I